MVIFDPIVTLDWKEIDRLGVNEMYLYHRIWHLGGGAELLNADKRRFSNHLQPLYIGKDIHNC